MRVRIPVIFVPILQCVSTAARQRKHSLLNLTSILSVVYNLLVKVTLLRRQLSVQIFLIWSKGECK